MIDSDATQNDPGCLYANAYAAHYSRKALTEALDIYEAIIVSFPDSAEAAWSRMRIQNIVHATFSREDLFATLIDLAR